MYQAAREAKRRPMCPLCAWSPKIVVTYGGGKWYLACPSCGDAVEIESEEKAQALRALCGQEAQP